MADTLLTICQNVADACQLSRPASIIGNTERTATMLLSRAKLEIEALARRPDSHWTVLEREFNFNPRDFGVTDGTGANQLIDSTTNFFTNTASVGDTVENTTTDAITTVTTVATNTLGLQDDIFVSGQGYNLYRQANALPSDFHYWIDETGWNKDTYWSMRGPMNPMEWRHYKHSVLGNSVTLRNRWRIRPYLDNNGDFVTKALFLDPAPTEVQDFIMEYVSNGLTYDAAGASQATWAADTDTPALDQFLIELGMTWRVLSRMGLPYAEELDEYEHQVEAALGRDGGGRVLDLGRTSKLSFLSTDNVPDTGIGQ